MDMQPGLQPGMDTTVGTGLDIARRLRRLGVDVSLQSLDHGHQGPDDSCFPYLPMRPDDIPSHPGVETLDVEAPGTTCSAAFVMRLPALPTSGAPSSASGECDSAADPETADRSEFYGRSGASSIFPHPPASRQQTPSAGIKLPGGPGGLPAHPAADSEAAAEAKAGAQAAPSGQPQAVPQGGRPEHPAIGTNWCKSATVLSACNENEPKQVASLTKIMTFLVTDMYVSRGCVDWEDLVFVHHDATTASGTSADLCWGDALKLKDLVFGLMLPSGNDAATAIAFHVGKHCCGPMSPSEVEEFRLWGPGKHYTGEWVHDPEHPISRFVCDMNRTARTLGMKATRFTNPHGLSHPRHQSTAREMACVTMACLQNRFFREVVQAKSYVTSTQAPSRVRKLVWENTNKLLSMRGRGMVCVGVKTGITPAAQACLSSLHILDSTEDEVLAVTLGSRNKTLRFVDNKRVVESAVKKLKAATEAVYR